MFLSYSELLNALDTGSTTKITINNKRVNREDFEREILLPRQDDALDGYRAEYNAMLMDKSRLLNSVAQERYYHPGPSTARAWRRPAPSLTGWYTM